MTKTTIQADAPIQECINDVLSVPREKFLNIASKLDSLAFPLRDGIPVLLENEARSLVAEESKP